MKSVATPLATTHTLAFHSGSALSNLAKYRTIVDNHQYLLLTRPHIAFVVNKLSQFMHRPTNNHWNAIKRLLQYLCGTTSHGIILHRNSPLSLHEFSDADWAGDKDDFASTNAYIVYLGHNLISWSSKKQRTVVRSFIEAEYHFVATIVVELR